MKKVIFLSILLMLQTFLFAYDQKSINFKNGVITDNYSKDKEFYVVVARENNVDSEDIFTFIPDAPEGYHLISIETYLIMEGKDHIKRVYIYTKNQNITTFSVSSAIQTDH